MRNITVPLAEILDLVICAESYGFSSDILLDSFSAMVETLTDEEIAEYARTTYLSEEARYAGYTDEDYDNAITCLTEWRDKYE